MGSACVNLMKLPPPAVKHQPFHRRKPKLRIVQKDFRFEGLVVKPREKTVKKEAVKTASEPSVPIISEYSSLTVEYAIEMFKENVRYYAYKYLPYAGGLDIDDIIQVGNIAIWKAIGRYNPDKSVKPLFALTLSEKHRNNVFAHYVVTCIVRAMWSEIRKFTGKKTFVNELLIFKNGKKQQ